MDLNLRFFTSFPNQFYHELVSKLGSCFGWIAKKPGDCLIGAARKGTDLHWPVKATIHGLTGTIVQSVTKTGGSLTHFNIKLVEIAPLSLIN